MRLGAEKIELFAKGTRKFSALVNAAQQALGPLHLVLNPAMGLLQVQGQQASLQDTDMAFMLWFIEQGWDAGNPWRPPAEGERDQQAAQDFLRHYAAVQKLHGGTDDRPAMALKKGMDLEWFRNRHKHLKINLINQLGRTLTERVRIQLLKKKPAFYGLPLALERIQVENHTS